MSGTHKQGWDVYDPVPKSCTRNPTYVYRFTVLLEEPLLPVYSLLDRG